jgi:putative membrane protein
MRPQLITIMGLALLLACGGDRDSAPAAGSASGETGMTADTGGSAAAGDTASTGTPTGEGPASLSGILSRLELVNTAEIQTSELAAKQAQSPAVKKIAGMLVTHHQKNRTELETLAQQKGVDLVPASGGNTARDTAGVLALRSLQGADFDTAYVAGQLEAHRSNLDAIRNQMLPAAQDADVRRFLEKTQTAMEKHLANLEEIQGQLQR